VIVLDGPGAARLRSPQAAAGGDNMATQASYREGASGLQIGCEWGPHGQEEI